MADTPIGMSKRDLESHMRWAMHKAPKDPAKRMDFICTLVVDLISRNNLAIAASLAERERSDLPDEG